MAKYFLRARIAGSRTLCSSTHGWCTAGAQLAHGWRTAGARLAHGWQCNGCAHMALKSKLLMKGMAKTKRPSLLATLFNFPHPGDSWSVQTVTQSSHTAGPLSVIKCNLLILHFNETLSPIVFSGRGILITEWAGRARSLRWLGMGKGA